MNHILKNEFMNYEINKMDACSDKKRLANLK